MAGVPEKVLNWLYSVLPSEYADVNRTYHDVAEALSHYPSLSPRTDVYTYENGASALLLLLSGTLPVTFRGATYGFPVAIWVPHNYPRESPLVYVTPEKDMVVRSGQHVGGDGRIYHPYLAQWEQYWDKSTIFDFLAVLRGVFAKEPPVRSRQQQYSAPPPPQAPAPPPVPPPPAEWRRSVQGPSAASPSPGPSGQTQAGAPIPPPKPPKPYEQSRSTPLQPQPNKYDQPPPLPPHPPQQPHQSYQQQQRNSYAPPNSWQQQNGQPHNIPQRQASHDTNPPTPISRPHPQIHTQGGYQGGSYEIGSPVSPISPERPSRYSKPAPPPQAPQNFSRPQPLQQYQGPPQPQQQYGLPQPHQQQYQQPQPPSGYPPHQQPPYQPQPLHQAPPQPKPAPVNLLDDSLEVTLPSQTGTQVDIPLPPVPPNPEKDALLRALSQSLCSQIAQTVNSNATAISPLLAQQAALQTAYSRLQSELAQLQDLDNVLATNEQILIGAMKEADRVMEDARNRKAPDVDEVLVAPTVVGGQLWNLVAEERALAEGLFLLGKGLDRGRVGGDVFVKQTRSLAREQFLKKALIKKISKGMGLDEYGMR
ncbi:UEV domain-containing protein [Lophiotrema nucula]|uniref:UEV domain-containing protein n=1 Tax=Lophiotrema nucula TaxID=690887 RepID=A0A6A5ZX25_9PLEO|nr:UEV domain-containing protein [Lophiotrema nucula]